MPEARPHPLGILAGLAFFALTSLRALHALDNNLFAAGVWIAIVSIVGFLVLSRGAGAAAPPSPGVAV